MALCFPESGAAVRILIAIKSCHRDWEQEQICRETWLSVFEHGRSVAGGGGTAFHIADYLFFRGIDGNLLQTPPDDVVSLPVCDDYISLPFKTQAICRYTLEHTYDYAFLADTDTYVDVLRLMQSGFERWPYSGWAWDGKGGYASGGSGYWLDRTCMALVAGAAFEMDWIHSERGSMRGEDLQVGGLLWKLGFEPHDDKRYRIRAPGPQADNDIITLHDVNRPAKGDIMRRLHEGYTQ